MELMDYWGDYPPAHLLLRAYMGVGKNAAQPVGAISLDNCTDGEMDEFLNAINGG